MIGALMRGQALGTLTASVPSLTTSIANTFENPAAMLARDNVGATVIKSLGLVTCDHAFELRDSTL
jgi:hypothetical protein